MRRVMTDKVQSFFLVPVGNDGDLGIGINDCGQIIQFAVDTDRHGSLGQARSDFFG